MNKREKISSKRLELSKLVEHWLRRAAVVKRSQRTSPGDPVLPQQLAFCEAEIAKAQDALVKLRRGSKRQRRAGWASGF
jgi:hypothetical protein